ncbi:hypothetical protein AKJ57_04100 [candidate division MSBL1 archaeon SCGC-AAA259A05]|uniref:JAB domain-containing protein n=1 Tax=candidate division MSBL1 archaeon SCGC-AAA259A05 TaxID=1698259 RepID=A0A133U8H6_9EURY|nr:hypothetical protein AKJ57_04100 [candidate division MSBL1 archaeon SCGC-AAA259A05]
MQPVLKNVASTQTSDYFLGTKQRNGDEKMQKSSKTQSKTTIPKIRTDEQLLTDSMSTFEEGLEEGDEKAFAILGKREENVYIITDLVEVPKQVSGKRIDGKEGPHFEPIAEEFENGIRQEAENRKLKMLGYLHSHPLGKGEFPMVECQLSKGDYERMVEKGEEIRGICVLPLRHICEVSEMEVPIHAYINFWHPNYGRPLSTIYKRSESYNGVYLIKTNEGWVAPAVETRSEY